MRGSRRWRRSGRRAGWRARARRDAVEHDEFADGVGDGGAAEQRAENSKTPTMTTACAGVMAREAMTVATMLAASWKPLV